MSIQDLELCDKCEQFARTGKGNLCPECLKKVYEYESKHNCICDVGIAGDTGAPGTSPFDIPGSECINTGELDDFVRRISKKFNVDEENIFMGRSNFPPSDPTCLVYLNFSRGCNYIEVFFRKELKPDGRWINENYMHHIKGLPEQKGTYDYRYGIAYI